jgi:hypothetical protein
MSSTISLIALDCLHALEKEIFEIASDFFFDDHNGCYVLDDELIGSKGAVVESKVVTSRKAGGHGPVSDAIFLE